MKNYQKKSLQGMTLVELLISMVLSAVLLLMIVNTFFVVKKMFITQQGLLRIQINARTIDYLLGRAIRNSGTVGCQRLQANKQLLQPYGFCNDPLKGISYAEIPNHLRSARKTLQRLVPESDMLWIQASHKDYSLSKWEYLSSKLKEGTIVIVTDCQAMTVYKTMPNLTINTASYAPSATVSILSSTVYYVAESLRKNSQGQPILALYSTDFNGRTIELVEGVAKLEFSYGEWVAGSISYQPAQAVQNWQQVVSVRLRALLNSVEEQEPVLQKWWDFEWPLLASN